VQSQLSQVRSTAQNILLNNVSGWTLLGDISLTFWLQSW